jgi:hypothetical protein
VAVKAVFQIGAVEAEKAIFRYDYYVAVIAIFTLASPILVLRSRPIEFLKVFDE